MCKCKFSKHFYITKTEIKSKKKESKQNKKCSSEKDEIKDFTRINSKKRCR